MTNNANPPPADEPGQPPKLTTAALAEKAPAHAMEQKITPFEVSGGVDASGKLLPVDYEKLTRDFGATRITKELLDRFERVTGKRAHRFMRRDMVISHRELEVILDRYEKGEPFFLYTGRGPSSDSMHVGHAVPFEFTKYLQDVFDCPLVVQLTDDEKFMHSDKITIEDSRRYAQENAKDIIGIGFDPNKTFIFTDTQYMTSCLPFYENVIAMAKRITVNQIKGTFGFNDSNNVGEFFFCAIQSAPAFATSFPHIFGDQPSRTRSIPCLIPCAIDQDPYFRQCRDNAPKMKYKKPSLIHSVFLPALQGPGSKMSASIDSSAIFLTDTPNQIKNKINKHAFSGGQDTLEKHRELGGRTKDDVPYQYLTFFMEDDEELERLRVGYEKGEVMTGEMKQRCIAELQAYVKGFQERRGQVSEEVRELYFEKRKLEYMGNPNPKQPEKKEDQKKEDGEKTERKAPPPKKEMYREQAEINELTKRHSKKMSVGRTKEAVENGEATKGHSKRNSVSKP